MAYFIKKVENKPDGIIFVDINALDEFADTFYQICDGFLKPLGIIAKAQRKILADNISKFKEILRTQGFLRFNYEGRQILIKIVRR